MTVGRQATVAGLAVVDVVGLTLVRLDAARLAHGVAHPQAWVDAVGADRALAELAGAGLWLAAAWLGVGLLAAAARALPGVTGRWAGHVARTLLPRAVRRLVVGSVGVGLLVSPVAAGAATPSGARTAPVAPGAAPSSSSVPGIPAPGWPVSPADPPPASTPAPSDGSTSVPAPIWPSGATPPVPESPRSASAPHHPAPAPRTPDPHASPAQGNPVRVRAGDCLWLIASRRLGTSATTEQIAAEWPRWYAANEGVIGSDPSTIRPGQVLRPPMPATKSQEASR